MKEIITNCTTCKKQIKLTGPKRVRFVKRGRAYCSKKCSDEYKRKISSITMAKTNRKYASERMKKNNPMKNPLIREKVKTTLRAIGHKPKIRGGNGRGPTIYQLALANALGWDMEVVIKTKMKRGSGYPTNYKIDIANEKLKIGIEVDGNSHGLIERQKQDQKKEKFLTGLGWKILRFKNQEIEKNMDDCVKKILSMI